MKLMAAHKVELGFPKDTFPVDSPELAISEKKRLGDTCKHQ